MISTVSLLDVYLQRITRVHDNPANNFWWLLKLCYHDETLIAFDDLCKKARAHGVELVVLFEQDRNRIYESMLVEIVEMDLVGAGLGGRSVVRLKHVNPSGVWYRLVWL